MLKKFASYYKPHLKLFFIDLFCAFVVSVCNLVYPKVAGKMIDSASLNYVLICSGVLLGIFLLKAVMNYVITYWGHVVGVRIQAAQSSVGKVLSSCAIRPPIVGSFSTMSTL